MREKYIDYLKVIGLIGLTLAHVSPPMDPAIKKL